MSTEWIIYIAVTSCYNLGGIDMETFQSVYHQEAKLSKFLLMVKSKGFNHKRHAIFVQAKRKARI